MSWQSNAYLVTMLPILILPLQYAYSYAFILHALEQMNVGNSGIESLFSHFCLQPQWTVGDRKLPDLSKVSRLKAVMKVSSGTSCSHDLFAFWGRLQS